MKESVMSNLTEQVFEAQRTGIVSRELHNALCMIIYRFPVEIRVLNEEEAAEFLIYFLTRRVSVLIDRFTYQGVPFEHYLKKTIWYQVKTFLREKGSKKLKEQIFSTYYLPKAYRSVSEPEIDAVLEETPQYRGKSSPIAEKIQEHAHIKKKLLIMFLSKSQSISDRHIDEASQLLDIPAEELFEKVSALRTSLDYRYERISKAEQRRTTIFMELLHLQHLLNAGMHHTSQHSGKESEIPERIAACRKRLEKSERILREARGKILYRNVASVLGIPSGTVGSALYYGRKYFEERLKEFSAEQEKENH